MFLYLRRLVLLLSLGLLGACSFHVTGMKMSENVPEESYVWDSRIIVYSCSDEDRSNQVPNFSGLQDALHLGCPRARGMAEADIQLIVQKQKPGSGSSPESRIHCWTLRGFPVFPDRESAGCTESESLLILK